MLYIASFIQVWLTTIPNCYHRKTPNKITESDRTTKHKAKQGLKSNEKYTHIQNNVGVAIVELSIILPWPVSDDEFLEIMLKLEEKTGIVNRFRHYTYTVVYKTCKI